MSHNKVKRDQATSDRRERQSSRGLTVAVMLVSVVALFLSFFQVDFANEHQYRSDPRLGDIVSIHNFPETIGSRSSVFLNECPSQSCAPLGSVPQYDQFAVAAIAKGDVFAGSDMWVGVLHKGKLGYLPVAQVSLLGTKEPASRFLIFAIGATYFILMLGLFALARTRKIRHLASSGGDDFDIVLASVVTSVGVSLIVLSLFLTRGEKTIGELLADSFVNLGAGFVGAAVTFILFQLILSSRNVTSQSIAETSDRIRETAGNLERKLESIDMRLVGLSSNMASGNCRCAMCRFFSSRRLSSRHRSQI
jgi:uncharacterized membrane protein